eukprot:scaffold66658_cov21-Phaeocystis_antarctica.AAC.1
MGTKPAKVIHRPSLPAKPAKPGLFPVTLKAFLQKGLRSAGGPKLLKWGLPGRSLNRSSASLWKALR